MKIVENLCLESLAEEFFGALWCIDPETLRTSKARGLEQDKTSLFLDKMKNILN